LKGVYHRFLSNEYNQDALSGKASKTAPSSSLKEQKGYNVLILS
jgi:hypothetical protein